MEKNNTSEMYASDFNGEKVIKQKDELIKFLDNRPALNSNYFIFTFSETGFPQLAIFVKNNYGVVYYLDNNQTFISSNPEPINVGETEIFYENSKGALVKLPQKSILSQNEIEATVLAFYETKYRPLLINWQEI
ncbi:hypothetical protein [Soonwooa sp.]|uniref:hypothetical protein n=1 Tax=Soonwooa sp. TaxID=1938592 RepID=UPI00260BCC9C|nr:hypothetical protein [Soonwooa sp.]